MQSVRSYILGDRQWKREHRIAHAKVMLTAATSQHDREFWRQVLNANMDQ